MTYRNVVVVPYEHLLTRQGGGHEHRGGPIWPDWDTQVAARFNRDGRPCDAMPSFEAPTATYGGRDYVWAGPVHPHFGHGMAEFYTRMAGSSRGLVDPVLVFASRATHPVDRYLASPRWLRGLLDWYGIKPRQTLFVTEPSRFESLSVFPQEEQLHRIGPSDAYLDLLEEISAEKLAGSRVPAELDFDPARPTYVSRAGVRVHFAGEAYLERVLQRCGMNVFRPEQFTIREQMTVYTASPRLVFAEGSALHGLQLLGRNLGHVTVLERRLDDHFDHFCEPFLRPRATRLEYVSCARGGIYGRNLRGREVQSQGIPLLDEERFLAWCDSFGIPARKEWCGEALAEEEEQDVRRWLEFVARRPHSEASRDLIRERLALEGFGQLRAYAAELLR